ncbi:AbrB/MazE/SpoVT family DNA-binding domain-containing protein [Candidatus Woesebacteria bacterium]|nr:AbrB/MazE/SpoVT family DNA-binding domain-containing protein [Candidatus Woesebacteria bacterium]
MKIVTVSPKFQVVIPKDIRKQSNITSGMKMAVEYKKNQIRFIPLEPLQSMRGILKGIDTTVKREKDRI